MLIIGSTALKVHMEKWEMRPFRTPQDLDLLCTRDEMNNFCLRHQLIVTRSQDGHYLIDDVPYYRHIEFHVAESSPAVTEYLRYAKEWPSGEQLNVYGDDIPVARPTILYSLKKSHRFLARHWEKHIRDYHLLKTMVFGIDPMPSITALKTAETKHVKTPSLNKTKTEFFDDHVSNRTFEHDQIHEVMAYRKRPMFEYIKDDSDTVKCSRDKFDALPMAARLQCVLEEAYVIALERGVIPMLYEGKKIADSESALQWALMRICTTLCSGWFREFAVEHYPAIWDARNKKYVQKFLKAVDKGTIKRIK